MFVVAVTQLSAPERFYAIDQSVQEPYWSVDPAEAVRFATKAEVDKAVDLVLDEDPIRYADGSMRPGRLCVEALGLSEYKPSARGIIEVRTDTGELVERHGLHGQIQDHPLRGMPLMERLLSCRLC